MQILFLIIKSEVCHMSAENVVKCSVNTCSYWKDMKCHAPSIEINSKVMSAKTSAETECTTFKPR